MPKPLSNDLPGLRDIYNVSLESLSAGILDITSSSTRGLPSPCPQHLRLIDCRYLLEDYPRLRIVELDDYSHLPYIPYSAVSYVWYGHIGPREIAKPTQGYFNVKDVENDGEHISIDMLIQIAKVSMKGSIAKKSAFTCLWPYSLAFGGRSSQGIFHSLFTFDFHTTPSPSFVYRI